MGIARKKVTYDKGAETRNPNPDRGATSLHKPAGSSLAGSKAASRARSLGDARRKANRKGANLAYGDREGRLSSLATTKRQSDADLGAQKAATDTGAHKDKQGYRQVHKHGERGDKRRPSYNPKHTANTKKEDLDTAKDIVKTILEKDLNAKERRALPNKDFVFPGKGEGPKGKQAGSYPIPDEKHARSALAMSAAHASPEKQAEVKAAVKKKFPNIKIGD